MHYVRVCANLRACMSPRVSLFVCVHTSISLVVQQTADTNYIPASAIYLCVCVRVCVCHPYMTILGENYFSSPCLMYLHTRFFFFLSSSLQVCSAPRYCKTYLHSQLGSVPRESHWRPACCLDRDKRCFVWRTYPSSHKF